MTYRLPFFESIDGDKVQQELQQYTVNPEISDEIVKQLAMPDPGAFLSALSTFSPAIITRKVAAKFYQKAATDNWKILPVRAYILGATSEEDIVNRLQNLLVVGMRKNVKKVLPLMDIVGSDTLAEFLEYNKPFAITWLKNSKSTLAEAKKALSTPA